MTRFTRRRFLTITAAAGASATSTALGTAARASEARWQGQALGAHAEIRIRQMDGRDAAPLFAEVEAELRRLEAIFSLYRSDSALAALNRDGRLELPPPELVEVLTLARGVHGATDGLFDPTVQPVFRLYAEAAARGAPVLQDRLADRLARVGFDGVTVTAGAIILPRDGSEMTLNGIAQGYLTDRISELLRRRGLTDVLVDIGEVLARGSRGWPVGIAGTGRRLVLTDRGLATSAPLGTVVDPAAGVGHILHPRRGWTPAPQRQVSILADTAALADALSTAAALMTDPQLDALRARGFDVLNIPA